MDTIKEIRYNQEGKDVTQFVYIFTLNRVGSRFHNFFKVIAIDFLLNKITHILVTEKRFEDNRAKLDKYSYVIN